MQTPPTAPEIPAKYAVGYTQREIIIDILQPLLHDARTPLNGMNGYLFELKNAFERGNYGEVFPLLELLEEQIRVQASIFNRAAYSAATLNKYSIEYELASPGMLFERVRKTLNPAAKAKGIKISSSVNSTFPPVIYLDPVNLYRILINLVNNAIVHSNAASIDLDCEQITGNSFRITVTDTGNGIPESELENIFKPGVQLSNNEPDRGQGLTIVKDLVQLLNGTIDVDSVLGKGTTFSLILPLKLFA
jgi:signal transduction histidine kinase